MGLPVPYTFCIHSKFNISCSINLCVSKYIIIILPGQVVSVSVSVLPDTQYKYIESSIKIDVIPYQFNEI